MTAAQPNLLVRLAIRPVMNVVDRLMTIAQVALRTLHCIITLVSAMPDTTIQVRAQYFHVPYATPLVSHVVKPTPTAHLVARKRLFKAMVPANVMLTTMTLTQTVLSFAYRVFQTAILVMQGRLQVVSVVPMHMLLPIQELANAKKPTMILTCLSW